MELIARAVKLSNNKELCLYSFASKYCYYHQTYALEKPRNDYPIFDNNLCEMLPLYMSDLTVNKLKKMCKKQSYAAYKKTIEDLFVKHDMNINDNRFKGRPFSMLDHCLWYDYKYGGEN